VTTGGRRQTDRVRDEMPLEESAADAQRLDQRLIVLTRTLPILRRLRARAAGATPESQR